MLISERIGGFIELGTFVRHGLDEIIAGQENELSGVMAEAEIKNPWFTQKSLTDSLSAIADWLDANLLNQWVKHYHLSEPPIVKHVAVIMAGNIPLVNFHDFLSVLISGHHFIGKLSSQDKVLLPFLAKKLIEANAEWQNSISFTEERLVEFDAVIATGSNNSSRYFHEYFGKYPNIIRKNRNSVALLTGNETAEELKLIYQDVFNYYGLGCRNVSLLMVPVGYNFPTLFDTWEGMADPTNLYKYKNNYDYYRSIYLVNSNKFFDTGYVSVIKNDSMASPISVLHYVEYQNEAEAMDFLTLNQSNIQCIVSHSPFAGHAIVAPGKAQEPGLMDYPDGIDIMQFLLAL